MQEIHNNLLDNRRPLNPVLHKAKVVDLFKKYRRVWAVAASIAGIIAITVSGLVAYFTPNTQPQLEQLSREVTILEKQTNDLTNEVRDSTKITRVPQNEIFKFGGTGFLIDAKGYLVTNAHVIKDAKTLLCKARDRNIKPLLLR